MSGFSANSSAGALPDPSFFSFCPLAFATRQSATAAAITAASAGRAASTAAAISRAVSTRTTSTPAGGGTSRRPRDEGDPRPKIPQRGGQRRPLRPDERLAI
jgi:hypothetical protein